MGRGLAIIVQVEGLRKVYEGRQRVVAVDGIDLGVREGELYGLLGPNGAGKTTTIGICTTRVLPTSGRVHIAGVDVVQSPALARRSMGIVPQFNTLDRSCTIYENIHFHCLYFGLSRAEAKQRTEQLLEQFYLSERADSYPSQLSGGLAQRVQIARAIAHRPKVLFLDEPSAGLDPQSRIAMWDAVRRLREEGITVVLTTHYMEEADALCDRVAIIDHGKILVEDTPAALKGSVGAQKVYALELEQSSRRGSRWLRQLTADAGRAWRGVHAQRNPHLRRQRRRPAAGDRSRQQSVRPARPHHHRNQPGDGLHPAHRARPARIGPREVHAEVEAHGNNQIRDRRNPSAGAGASARCVHGCAVRARLRGAVSARPACAAPRDGSVPGARHHESRCSSSSSSPTSCRT